jgi:AMMECR1 domain-containing protein
VSILSELEPLAFGSPDELLAQLRPHRDGLVLRVGDRTATFLPQVWEQLPDRARFLEQLSRKAGLATSAWRQPGAEVSRYTVEAFAEPAERVAATRGQ